MLGIRKGLVVDCKAILKYMVNLLNYRSLLDHWTHAIPSLSFLSILLRIHFLFGLFLFKVLFGGIPLMIFVVLIGLIMFMRKYFIDSLSLGMYSFSFVDSSSQEFLSK